MSVVSISASNGLVLTLSEADSDQTLDLQLSRGTPGTDAVWTEITQAAYDALGTPDPDTLYVVIG